MTDSRPEESDQLPEEGPSEQVVDDEAGDRDDSPEAPREDDSGGETTGNPENAG